MRSAAAVLPLLVLSAALLAGCHGTGSHDAAPAADPPLDGEGNEGRPGATAPPDGTEPQGDDGGNETRDEGDENGDAPPGDDAECHEHDPPQTAHPTEHKVATVDEIRCPGHYAKTKNGSGTAWQVPAWQTGDWWLYEVSQFGNCVARYRFEVTGTASAWDLGVYTLKQTTYNCDGEETGTSSLNRTQDHLTVLQQTGFVFHESIFPMRTGMEWKTMILNKKLAEASVAHVPNYSFGLESVEAWRVTFEWPTSGGGTAEQEAWWGVEVGNVLVIERTVGISFERVELIDWHGDDDDGPQLPPLPPLP